MHKKLIPPAITPGEWSVEAEPNGLTYSVWNGDTLVFEAQTRTDAVAAAATPVTNKALEFVWQYLAMQSEKGFPFPAPKQLFEAVRSALLAAGYTEAPES